MKANFFTFGNRNYINNAVVLADTLEKITTVFGDVKNLKLQFKKPFFSQGEFIISPHKVEGHYVGHFEVDGVLLYFAYTPINVSLEEKILTVDDIKSKIDMVNICYYIAENCHQMGWQSFEKIYGLRTATDKSIVVIYEIPDTAIITNIIKQQRIPELQILEPELIADRRFKLSVLLDGKFFCHRYHSIKEFIR